MHTRAYWENVSLSLSLSLPRVLADEETEIIIALSRVFELRTVKARGGRPRPSQTTVGISLITKSRSAADPHEGISDRGMI